MEDIMAKRIMRKLVRDDGTLDIIIGEKRETYNPTELNKAMQLRLMLHGLSQKLGDTCAGKVPSFRPVDEMWNQLKGGDWSKRKPGTPKVSEDRLRAVLTAQGMNEEQVAAIIAASTELKPEAKAKATKAKAK
jgi:hypothetical protein